LSEKRPSKARRWGLGLALVAAVALIGAFWWYSPTFKLPPPDGPHRVGVIAFELVDTNRRGLLGTSPDLPRQIPVRIWYPAADDARGATRAYLESFEARSLGRNFGEGAHFFAYLSRIDTHSIVDAPVKQGGGWPVVLYNHGFWCYPEQNTALMEQLASHGYIVVSIGHPGDAVEMRFADGTVVPPYSGDDEQLDTELFDGMAAFMGATSDDERIAGLRRFEAASVAHRIGQSALIWRDDNLFVYRALREGSVPEGALEVAASIDYTNLAVVGMSFGGSTAPAVCEALEECKASVNLDGESFDFSMYNHEVREPLLVLLTGQNFIEKQLDDPGVNPTDYAYERWAHAGERADIVRFRVASLRHAGLLDVLLSARRPWNAQMYGTIDGRRGIALINAAVMGFLDQHVRGQANADFPRSFFASFPEATPHDAFHVRQAWLKRNIERGCSEEGIRSLTQRNDFERMRLGEWFTAFAETGDAGCGGDSQPAAGPHSDADASPLPIEAEGV
jgi:hypothetical protein